MKNQNQKFEYMFLGRLQQDCDYYLNCGGRDANHCLWAQDEQKQIDIMRETYNKLKIKPEWLSWEEIDEYAKRMNVK